MRFVFLMDMEVAGGQFMLERLLERRLIPEIVIEEESSNAEEHKNIWIDRLQGKTLAPPVSVQVKKHGLKYERISDINSQPCEELIKGLKPDLVVLGGTRRIIKENIFSIPRWGTLLSHPGLLPYVRGAASAAWSIYSDIQVGCSCIIIDAGIDTGPILRSKIVPVYESDTYDEIIERNLIYSGELMAEVVSTIKEKDGPIKGETQDLNIGKTYKTMPPMLVKEVKEKLAKGTYRWLKKGTSLSE